MKKIIQIVAVAVLFTGCNRHTEKPSEKVTVKVDEKPGSDEEKNKATAMRFYAEVVNAHHVDAIDGFASANYLEHQYDTHYDSDLKGVKKAFKDYFTAFPDMHVKVNFVMADGDLVTAQITTTGTNTGPIYGRKATNKKIEINGVDITRFKNGKVVEHWGYAEEGKMLAQLGLIRPLMKEERKEQQQARNRKDNKVSIASAEVKGN